MDIVWEFAGSYRAGRVPRYLKAADTLAFLDQAKNVF
jgi:hypothetical protein